MAFRPPPFFKKPSLMTTTPFVSKLPQPTKTPVVPFLPGTTRAVIPYTPSPDASINYTNEPIMPETSWWDNFTSGLDKDFLTSALGSLGDFGGQASGGRGGGGGGGGGRGGGGNIRPAGFLPPVLPDIPAQAPNPGWYLNLPKEQKYRYSGGF